MQEPKYSRRQTIVKFHDLHSWNWEEIAELLLMNKRDVQNAYWKAKHPEQTKAQLERWRQSHHEYMIKYGGNWRRTNRVKRRMHEKTYRDKKRMKRKYGGIYATRYAT
jgi:hypothetical protein